MYQVSNAVKIHFNTTIMTLYEFILLDKSQQYEVTFQKGEFVDAHIETNKRFALYAVDTF